MSTKRVGSLSQVAARAGKGEGISYPLRDFLDGFYADPMFEKVSEESQLLADAMIDGGPTDA